MINYPDFFPFGIGLVPAFPDNRVSTVNGHALDPCTDVDAKDTLA